MAQLPAEMIHHILTFIPDYELKNAMLVNKDLYGRCSKLLSFKTRLTITKKILDDESIVESMIHSLRRFKELSITLGKFKILHLERLQSILETHGRTISYLYINAVGKSGLKFKQSVLVKWLLAMPNLRDVHAGGLFSCEQIQDDDETELVHTKLTTIGLCPLGLALKLHKTPKACIRSLQLNDKSPLPNITEVFKKHSESLKKLTLFRPVYTDPKPFTQLKLTKFVCLYSEYMHKRAHDNFLSEIIASQTNLDTLQLGEGDLCSNSYPVGSPLLRLICSQKNLVELALGFSDQITVGDVNHLQRLTNLEELQIQMNFFQFTVGKEILEAFSNVKLPMLQKLSLQVNVEHLTPAVLKNMGENFPNLVEYSGDYNHNGADTELETFNDFLDAFPKLETLSLCESHYEFIEGRTYPNLKKLDLWCENEEIDISPQIIRSLPNLEEIHVEAMLPRYKTLKAILRSNISIIDITIPCINHLSTKQQCKLGRMVGLIHEQKPEANVNLTLCNCEV